MPASCDDTELLRAQVAACMNLLRPELLAQWSRAELLEALQEHEANTRLGVLSGLSEEELAAQALAHGGADNNPATPE